VKFHKELIIESGHCYECYFYNSPTYCSKCNLSFTTEVYKLKPTPQNILENEIPIVRKIVNDEKWFLSEKLGYDVGQTHPDVQMRVADILIRIGEDLRKETELFIKNSKLVGESEDKLS